MDTAARDELIAAWAGWARGLALAVVRRRHLSVSIDDAIAAANLALVEAAGRYRAGPLPFDGFAYLRIVGAVLDLSYGDNLEVGRTLAGKRRFRPVDLDIEPITWRLRDPAPGPAEQLEAAESLRWVGRQLAALPPREALVIKLVYVDGLRLVDAGRALGVSEGRAYQLAKAGIARIRRNLTG